MEDYYRLIEHNNEDYEEFPLTRSNSNYHRVSKVTHTTEENIYRFNDEFTTIELIIITISFVFIFTAFIMLLKIHNLI